MLERITVRHTRRASTSGRARSSSSPLLARTLRRLHSDSGQNLIEFALITPFVLVFIAAIVVFGLALFARSNLQQAVREGARQASVGATLTEVQDLAAGNANDMIDPSEVQWCHPVDDDGTQGKLGDQVKVYIVDDDDGNEGIPFTLVPSNGIFKAFGVNDVTVRLSPVATARLEESLPAGAEVNCP